MANGTNGNGETRKTVAQLAKEVVQQKTSIEVLRNEVKSVASVNEKLDNTIDKLTDISSSIKSMLAVHEEKLSRQDKVDEIIFEKLRERQQEIQDVHASLKAEMATSEKRLLVEIKSLKLEIGNRVSTLEKYKWLILGGAIVIGWILSTNFKTIIEMMS